MPTYPLPTLAATVTSSGITAPSLNDILSSLIASYQGIYGTDVYLGSDTQDGQLLGIFAQAVYDANQVAIAVYNEFSPSTAVGTGLSSVVKINGLRRLVASASTAVVTVVGQAGTTILNGLVGDDQNLNTQWLLPATVEIPVSGTIDVTATSAAVGAVAAGIGTLTVILTPTPGWQSVTNAAAAVPGAAVETDAALRQRQSKSTALPALTVLEGVYAALANLTGVERVAAYQNDTAIIDANGAPAHSAYFVVEGGDAVTICETIAAKLSPGPSTYGSVSETVIDANGVPAIIYYDPLVLVTIYVAISITARTGYVSSTAALIQEAVAGSLTAYDIGEQSYLSRLYAPANLSGTAAVNATGVVQTTLDTLSATYDIPPTVGIAQARDDMVITGMSDLSNFSVQSVANYAVGSAVLVTVSTGSLVQAAITAISGTTLTISPALPVGTTLVNGDPVYVVGDVAISYKEAALASSSDILVRLV